jgi:hypothetical protein
MKTRFRSDADEWIPDGRKITSPANLDMIRKTLEADGPIIVEHWFYRGASAPDRLVFDDFDAFNDYLNANAFAGDAIHIWSFAAVCKDDNELAYGKCPDENGLVPKRGAY